MPLKIFKPTSAGRRQMTGIDYSVLTKKKPEKSLVVTVKRSAGRNNQGRITTRHQSGGVKRSYRLVDFKQTKRNIPAKVLAVEYDPYRSAFIALICYKDGEKSYILAPQNLKAGGEVIASDSAPISVGNRLPLRGIPLGAYIYNIELQEGRGGQIARSAGCSVQLLAKEEGYANLLMPSSEIRKVSEKCWASIGVLSNPEHNLVTIGKAGRNRYLGIRPTVRGTAMNPRDHAHGGGEGRTTIGRPHPMTPWGKIARGVKTRKRKNLSNKYIVRRRVKK